MLPVRRFFVSQQAVQATRSLRPSTLFTASFHTSRLSALPIPTSTDDVSSTDSKNTEGQGLNEAGSGNKNTPNEHNPTNKTSNTGRVAPTPDNPSERKSGSKLPGKVSRSDLPKSPSVPKNAPSAGFSTTTSRQRDHNVNSDELKSSIKATAKKAKAKVANAVDSASETVRHVGAKVGVGAAYAKEEAKHAFNESRADFTASMRNAQADPTPYSSQSSAVDTEAMKAKARETASSVKATLGSVVESVKGVAQSVAETVKSSTASVSAKAADMKENTADRLAGMGERMEAKFEKIGDNLMKSGEAIERRNNEPETPPQPLPLDEVDHMPNPKDLNDVLPGTGIKDQKKNEPLADGSGTRGQFPG